MRYTVLWDGTRKGIGQDPMKTDRPTDRLRQEDDVSRSGHKSRDLYSVYQSYIPSLSRQTAVGDCVAVVYQIMLCTAGTVRAQCGVAAVSVRTPVKSNADSIQQNLENLNLD